MSVRFPLYSGGSTSTFSIGNEAGNYEFYVWGNSIKWDGYVDNEFDVNKQVEEKNKDLKCMIVTLATEIMLQNLELKRLNERLSSIEERAVVKWEP